MNIDQLIARSHDENEIKELKQQKRLLRNRQAALDSRQRKKQHTERLEEEKKVHSAIIQELEDRLTAMTVQCQDVARERDFLRHKADTLQLEKEEMVRSHTIETGELRKNVSYLKDQIENLERNQQGSNFGDAFGFDSGFNLENGWEDPMDVVDIARPVKNEKGEAEKPQTGLLLILLLCGAFVASQGATGAAPSLPPLPKQLQTASASVLQNIFQDAGVTESTRVEIAPTTTGDWALSKSDVPQMVGLESSMSVINQYDRTSKPSLEQQHAEFMQLTPAEYNEVTSTSFLREPETVDHRNRQRIRENLAAMSRNGKQSVAEVYTRSLLWDKVDAEVVRRFAAFARQAQAQQAATNNDDGGAACHS